MNFTNFNISEHHLQFPAKRAREAEQNMSFGQGAEILDFWPVLMGHLAKYSFDISKNLLQSGPNIAMPNGFSILYIQWCTVKIQILSWLSKWEF